MYASTRKKIASSIFLLLIAISSNNASAMDSFVSPSENDSNSDTPAHLFILAGQSNMVRLDPNISFTPAVIQAFGKESVIVVKDAAGGQAISRWYKDWKSVQGQPAEQGQRGDLYDRLKKKVTKAIQGRDLKTITLVWAQGESDAARNHTAVYRKSLEGLLNQLRQDLNRDDIHFVLGRVSDYTLVTGKHPEWPAMRELQVKFAESNPLGGWVNADDLNDKTDPKTGQLRNDVHYTKEGYRIFGQRLADKAIALIELNSLPGEVTDFHGYRCHQFKTANGANVKVICPKTAAAGKPWLWRSLFWESIKPVYKADLTLVDQGYYVVLVHGDVTGHPKGNAKIDAAYELLTSKYGFANKCSMASLSRGTLSLFRWAAANPEKVNSIYVDNGVCNITSWPAGKQVPGSGSQGSGNPKSWEKFKRTFGYTTDAQALNSKQSPIDQLEPLAKAGVPILMVCGSKDKAVPYEENDAILEQRYRALGGPIEVIIQDKGHTHGMQDPTPVINFIKTNSQPNAPKAVVLPGI